MTQAALADEVDTSTQYISQLERGMRSASLDLVDDLAKVLRTTAAELFTVGESRDAESLSDGTKRIGTLLAEWSGADQDRLIAILVQLRGVAGTASRDRSEVAASKKSKGRSARRSK